MRKLQYLAIIYSCLLHTVMANENLSIQNTENQIKRDHYLVGSDSNYPPFQLRDGNGKIIGFEPELLKRIGELENFTVEVVYYPRYSWQKALDNNEVDIFASALGISPKRTAVAEMSDPILDFYDAIYILDIPENKDIQKISDFIRKKFVGVTSSKSTFEFVKGLNDGSNTITMKDSIFLALREVWAGHADAVTNNNRLFQYYGKKYPRFKYRLIPLNLEKIRTFGFAVKKGRTDLRDRINEGLKKAKADGSFQKIFENWFDVESKEKGAT